jgi:hypothetical protein
MSRECFNGEMAKFGTGKFCPQLTAYKKDVGHGIPEYDAFEHAYHLTPEEIAALKRKHTLSLGMVGQHCPQHCELKDVIAQQAHASERLRRENPDLKEKIWKINPKDA